MVPTPRFHGHRCHIVSSPKCFTSVKQLLFHLTPYLHFAQLGEHCELHASAGVAVSTLPSLLRVLVRYVTLWLATVCLACNVCLGTAWLAG